ncbi:hypothetical protein [Pseudoalteromonas luteoviolacea]|uniref:hypothetical protein n=1 Tax=Pseudoalteromonas luteoviolacea TaxID=43657 RepID=UPI001153182C|nr:hypothetical protein [Pseudoalteromonas luteoviolacea]TQF69570.1 hypothetical protein FLM44_00185 [Pseudoalteromonas luteoviolacea]
MEIDILVLALLFGVLFLAIALCVCAATFRRTTMETVHDKIKVDAHPCDFQLKRKNRELLKAAELLAKEEILEEGLITDVFEGLSEEEMLKLELEFKFEARQTLKALIQMGVINIEQIKRSMIKKKKQA